MPDKIDSIFIHGNDLYIQGQISNAEPNYCKDSNPSNAEAAEMIAAADATEGDIIDVGDTNGICVPEGAGDTDMVDNINEDIEIIDSPEYSDFDSDYSEDSYKSVQFRTVRGVLNLETFKWREISEMYIQSDNEAEYRFTRLPYQH